MQYFGILVNFAITMILVRFTGIYLSFRKFIKYVCEQI